jgi:hypothetical protein
MKLFVEDVYWLRHEDYLVGPLLKCDQSLVNHESVVRVKSKVWHNNVEVLLEETLNRSLILLKENDANIITFLIDFDEECLIKDCLLNGFFRKSILVDPALNVLVKHSELDSIHLRNQATWNEEISSIKEDVSLISSVKIVHCACHLRIDWTIQFLIVENVVQK